MIRLHSLAYTYPGETKPAFSDVSLSAEAGECLCLTGHSGCGKTSLLLAIKGLLTEGTLTGEIKVAEASTGDGEACGQVGLVFQNAESQILCTTVAEEVAFGPENLCVPADEIERRIRSSLQDVRLTGFWNRNVERLSAGQKHRLAVASVLAMNPHLLLLDEPSSQLDATGKAELAEVLTSLKKQGYTLLIVEHDLEAFKDLVDRYYVMDHGLISKVSDSIPDELVDRSVFGCRNVVVAGEKGIEGTGKKTPAVSTDGLWISYPGVGDVLKDINLTVFKGDRIHLFGRNGSGKSTLLAAIVGVVRPNAGMIRVDNVNVTSATRLFGKVGYMVQNPERQLFENTVFEEVAFSLKRLHLSAEFVQERVTETLEICEVGHLADRLPLSLSFGEKHRVALASVLAPNPETLLLDEPFSGLDFGQRRRLLSILANLREKCGTTILIASHNPLPDQSWPDRVICLNNGTIG